MTFTVTRKNTEQAHTELMKLKFNMHVSTIDEDLYGYKKKLLSICPKKKNPGSQHAEKNSLVFWQKKKKVGLTQNNPGPPPENQMVRP